MYFLKVNSILLFFALIFSLMNEVVHTSPTIGSNFEEVLACFLSSYLMLQFVS